MMENSIIKLNLKDKIYEIRGQKVMLDFELAEIYGYSTKAFNQQVNRNIEKFDEDFYFQLTDDEMLELSRSQNVTSKSLENHLLDLSLQVNKNTIAKAAALTVISLLYSA